MRQKGKYLFLFLISISFFTSSFAQVEGWTMHNCGRDLYVNDVCFLNADSGWAVGYDGWAGFGFVMSTIDGGVSWITQDSSSTVYRAIHFTDKEHGWAVGYRNSANQGAIYHTNNGGESWYLKDSCRYELSDLFFLNRDTGYVVGGGRGQTAVLRTTDAGESWDSLNAWGGHMHTVFFVNDTLGWVAGERGAVSKTVDGGDSWSTTSVDVGFFFISSFHAIDQDTAWMVGNDQIFKTEDGGEVWEAMVDPSNARYQACFFSNSKSGWVTVSESSTSEIIHTSDGGESWQVQASLPNVNILSSFSFINDTAGWCSGATGVILKTSSAGIVSVRNIEDAANEGQEQFRLEQNFPNPFDTHTIISYNLATDGLVRLVVYNMLGEKVRILVNGKQSAGTHSLTFDGAGLPSGLYYYKLTDRGSNSVKEMLLLRH